MLRRRGGWRKRRQGNPDGCAPAWGALDQDAAVMPAHDPLDEAEPEAGSVGLLGPGRVASIKALKNVRESLGCDTDAIVPDFDDDFTRVSGHLDVDVPTGSCVLDRVVEQVEDGPLQPARIARYGESGPGVH